MCYQGQEWYSKSLEVLNPLRFHLFEMIQRAEQVNHLNELMENSPTFPVKQIEEAKAALNKAELHFTGKEINE